VARNVEIKARIPDLRAIRAKAASLSSAGPEVIDQTDTFFGVPSGRLKVREFSDGSGEMIAYQRANEQGPKESVYTRVRCEAAKDLVRALASVMPVRGVVVKRRELFLVGRTRIHLDEVEHLGSFAELEVVLAEGDSVVDGRREAEELLDALGIPGAALVPEAYIDLLETASHSTAGFPLSGGMLPRGGP